jgi:hypothetical protein
MFFIAAVLLSNLISPFSIEGNVICSPTYGDNLDFERQGFISKLTPSNRIVVFPEAFS